VGCLQFIRTLPLHAALKLSDQGYRVGRRYAMETGSHTTCIIARGENENVRRRLRLHVIAPTAPIVGVQAIMVKGVARVHIWSAEFGHESGP
jgi:hypothetical protein